jgi:hypothetical protein
VEPFHEGRNAINDRCNTLNEDAVTLDLGVVMAALAALVEAGLGSSYTSEWSCEERKTAEIRSPPNSVGNVRPLPPWVRLGGKRSDKKLVGDGLP